MDPLAAVTAVAAARAVMAARTAIATRQSGLPGAAPDSASHTDLSPSGLLVEALLQQPAATGTALAEATPLLAAAPPAGPQAPLAQALQQAMRQSGLFYESHLAAWQQGELPLAELLQEPQGRLAPLPVPASPALVQLPASIAGSTAPPAAQAGHVADGATATAIELRSAGHAGSAPAWQQVVDPRAGSVVQQQLLSLDTQALPWQGQVWPGQSLDWMVAPEVDPEAGRRPEVPTAWTSRLRLKLPALGGVEAELRWSAGRCSLRLIAPAAQLPELRAELPALAQALADAGVPTERIVVAPPREAQHD